MIAPISNLKDDKFEIPSSEFLYQFRVVVCTLFTAAIFSRARNSSHFDSAHFSYLFIDEAACIPQSVTFIPIAGVCTDFNKVHSKIILAGDPKQLEPVVKSIHAKELGLSKSFMEFLFDQKCYRRNPLSKNFNPQHIVQLKKNYRSHEKILQIANELFYENMLQAKASSGWYYFQVCNFLKFDIFYFKFHVS